MYRITALRQIQGLAQRLRTAERLVEENKVTPLPEMDAYTVEGEEGKRYLVHSDGVCSCPDWEYRYAEHLGYCKHRLATLVWLERHGEAA